MSRRSLLPFAVLALMIAGAMTGAAAKVPSPPGQMTFDVSALNATSDAFATGHCEIDAPSPQMGDVMCGTDRDDDNMVTNTDPHPASGVPGDFDDEIVTGVTGTNISFCFQRDLDNSDPANAGGDDWDTVLVALSYTGSSLVTLSTPVGFVDVYLAITSQSTAC